MSAGAGRVKVVKVTYRFIAPGATVQVVDAGTASTWQIVRLMLHSQQASQTFLRPFESDLKW
jgi:hypothetical protein